MQVLKLKISWQFEEYAINFVLAAFFLPLNSNIYNFEIEMVYGEPSIDDFEFIKPITQGLFLSILYLQKITFIIYFITK